jgi:hypothetical protein
MTVGAFADIDVVLLLCAVGARVGLLIEFSDEDDDIADENAPIAL